MAKEFEAELLGMLGSLYRYAYSLARSREAAEDLVQTTCEKALAAQSTFDPSTRLQPWLFRILRNAWLDQVRRRQTSGPQVDVADHAEILATDGAAAAESVLMLKSVLSAIDRLPQEQREVLLLVCVEDCSYREAANILDIPIGTVMSRLARARAAIAQETGIN